MKQAHHLPSAGSPAFLPITGTEPSASSLMFPQGHTTPPVTYASSVPHIFSSALGLLLKVQVLIGIYDIKLAILSVRLGGIDSTQNAMRPSALSPKSSITPTGNSKPFGTNTLCPPSPAPANLKSTSVSLTLSGYVIHMKGHHVAFVLWHLTCFPKVLRVPTRC